MSNGRKATGLDAIAEQAAAAAQAPQPGPSLYDMLQQLHPAVRPQKTPMGLAVQVVPNPDRTEGAPPKLLLVTKIQGTHVDFTFFQPAEWEALVEQVEQAKPLLTTTLDVATSIPAALRGV